MKTKYILLSALGAMAMTACNDEFLGRYPQTDISSEGFFNSVEDLKTYTNGF